MHDETLPHETDRSDAVGDRMRDDDSGMESRGPGGEERDERGQERDGGSSPDRQRFRADDLEKSIRERQGQERGEVF